MLLSFPAIGLVAAPVPKDVKGKLPDTEDAVPTTDAERAAIKTTSSNNLKQIMLAVHNYASANQDKLVRNVADKDGKHLLSWRVELLPYLEEDQIYKLIRRDEPWDSPDNMKVLEKMPKVFESPRAKTRKGYTVYQGFSGFGVIGSRYNIGGIPDGTANTIWCAEVTAAVPWTKPVDLPFDPQKDVPKFGKAFGEKPLAALCDGSVRYIDLKKISEKTLKNAITPDEGEVLGEDW